MPFSWSLSMSLSWCQCGQLGAFVTPNHATDGEFIVHAPVPQLVTRRQEVSASVVFNKEIHLGTSRLQLITDARAGTLADSLRSTIMCIMHAMHSCTNQARQALWRPASCVSGR
jgi:hypothetical protein